MINACAAAVSGRARKRLSRWSRCARLRLVLVLLCGSGMMAEPLAPVAAAEPIVAGIDVSSHQERVDWRHWWDQGARFAYVKATEGTGYQSPTFAGQYAGAARVGMLRGAYHYALPDRSSGADQATYFVEHGGGWVPDGRTLPGALDIEYNPYGPACYGLSQQQMGAWIADFSETYYALTGRHLVIYTATSWWNQCVGATFAAYTDTHPLWLARYAPQVGPMPTGWGAHTFWQHSTTPLDQNRFTGTYQQLRALAAG